MILTVEEITALPSTSRILFIECQGNTQLEWRAPTGKGVVDTSYSEWTGVPLSLLLREDGVQRGAAWIVAEGADGGGNERSIPLTKAMDDVLVAYGQNGEVVRPEDGYPLRLIVPGWSVAGRRAVGACDRCGHLAGGRTVAHLRPGGAPTGAEVEAWKTTIPFDGVGVPAGSGTAVLGHAIYVERCAACHGERGENGKYDRLAGGRGTLTTDRPVLTVGSFWPYAPTLWSYINSFPAR